MPERKIYVAGHRGMVGAAVVRALQQRGTDKIVTRKRSELDVADRPALLEFYLSEQPDVAIICAARVGGIQANATYPAEFLYQNLTLAAASIDAAFSAGIKRLLFLGSTCIYPKHAEQPLRENSLLSGALEPTNEPYALAKIAGLKLCQYYRKQYGVLYHSVMPTNLYGPQDNYHPQNSHVLPALIRRFHEARESGQPAITIWGSGTPRREFLHADDAADGILHMIGLDNPPDWLNLGTGKDISIAELAQLVADTVGYSGKLEFDLSKPDGTPRKVTDISLLQATGWKPKIELAEGVARTCQTFREEREAGHLREA